MSHLLAHWNTYLQVLLRLYLSSHLGPCFTAAFNPAYGAAASCDECGKEGTVIFFPTLKEEEEEEEGDCDPGRQSRWHPRLSGLFKEHCRRGPESDKPTTQPGMISKLPLLLSTPKTSRFNTFSELQIAAHSRVTWVYWAVVVRSFLTAESC